MSDLGLTTLGRERRAENTKAQLLAALVIKAGGTVIVPAADADATEGYSLSVTVVAGEYRLFTRRLKPVDGGSVDR